ncbi:MAG: hypothetical protein GY844_19000 [Bradyrhizobium sp.]|nr:hypothetical protein [Bradyrhizobium sp.]
MIHQVRVCVVERSQDDEIYIVALHEGGDATRWHAQRVINAVRARLPMQKMAADIVVLAGNQGEPSAFGSSPEAESFVRQLVPDLQSYRWQNREFDW